MSSGRKAADAVAPRMEQENRPYIQEHWPELEEISNRNWERTDILQEILSELKYRSRPGAKDLRAKVTERLVEISQQRFVWPSTDITPGHESLDADQLRYSRGLLKFMGYSVGQNGGIRTERQSILDYAYNEIIPRVISALYMDEWGGPKTSQRLHKMADSIASFVRNAKRRIDADMDLAISEWEEDLAYIKIQYYDSRYDFPWPLVSIE
jgi:hypothetical protein